MKEPVTERYLAQLRGCWLGKNIGGTLGMPFEGSKEMNDATFYTQELGGAPAPNDDLDLQLVWLLAVEEHGIYHLTPEIMGEYWLNHITGPWNEYSICRQNLANGLKPPLSGSCNNSEWHWSNGAWIRSEIWACLFPGAPDEAIRFAYLDASCDHDGEGIYAEIFTAALESAAFVISDMQTLIDIALSKIPADSRVAQCVLTARQCHAEKRPFADARNAVLKAVEDLGFFQAPGNVGFLTLGLLYGEGDFGATVCRAANCGDDTDCTAGTAGAIMGIILGDNGIPERWKAPVGDSIRNIAIDALATQCPPTIDKLCDRVARLRRAVCQENPVLLEEGRDSLEAMLDQTIARLILKRSPYEMSWRLPFGLLGIDYEDGPEIAPGETKRLRFRLRHSTLEDPVLELSWRLPDGWRLEEGSGCQLHAQRAWCQTAIMEQRLTAGPFTAAFQYLELVVKVKGRQVPQVVVVPFQRRGALAFNHMEFFCGDRDVRLCSRRGLDYSHVHRNEIEF